MSTICRATGSTGFSDVIGSWNTVAIRCPRMSRIRPGVGTARPWFLAIVANECRMARRNRWWSVLRYAEPAPAAAAETDIAGGMDLRRQIQGLPLDDRLLLHLYFVLDLPAAEVAQVLGIRTGAVKSRLHRVTRRLRSQLVTAEVTS